MVIFPTDQHHKIFLCHAPKYEEGFEEFKKGVRYLTLAEVLFLPDFASSDLERNDLDALNGVLFDLSCCLDGKNELLSDFFISGEATKDELGDASFDVLLLELEEEEVARVGNPPRAPRLLSGGRDDAFTSLYLIESGLISFNLAPLLDRFVDFILLEFSGNIFGISEETSMLSKLSTSLFSLPPLNCFCISISDSPSNGGSTSIGSNADGSSIG